MTRPASLLRPASYAHCWVCTWMELLTRWLGFDQVGLEPSLALTHWVTTTNFMSFRSIPRFRANLGAPSGGSGHAQAATVSARVCAGAFPPLHSSGTARVPCRGGKRHPNDGS